MMQLIVRTYEYQGQKLALVLEHTFIGKTRAEALHYSKSHEATDSFYRKTGGHLVARNAFSGVGPTIAHAKYKGIQTVTDAQFRRRER
ncbi:MAG TPA: hypothetical protein VE967_19635 [Gemmatimonadaceae bacterium]|nr:hypothetical protein [Gemmatimonadaceae bacterium]